MLHKLEFFRTMHYFYFYLSSLGIFIAVKAGYGYPIKSIFIIGAALINMYFSYYAEFRVRELLIVKRTHWLFSHLVIISLVIVHYLVLLSRNPFSAVLESTLIITTYLGLLRSLVILMMKLKLFDAVLQVTGFSKEHLGMKKAVFLITERAYIFEKLLRAADPDAILKYNIGTSKKADEALRKLDESQTTDRIKDNMKFLFIYIYENKLDCSASPPERKRIKKILDTLRKTADI